MSPSPLPIRSRAADEELAARTHAAALGVELRSPLAQIELAASQLDREALTPIARGQAALIFEAVAQIDELVERMLRVLVPPRRARCEDRDLAGVIGALRRRFAGVLDACGVEWIDAGSPDPPVTGNPDQVRKLATELLRLALALCAEGGSFRLEVGRAARSLELRLDCRRAEALEPEALETAHAAVEHARTIVFENGGFLSGESQPRESTVRLVVPHLEITRDEQEASCPES